MKLFGTAICMLTMALASASAVAQSSVPPHAPGEAPIAADGVPPEMAGLDIVEHLGEKVPLDLALNGEDGAQTTLGTVLKSGKPVILHLGYFKCPMLCTLVLNEGIRSLGKIDLSLGKDFEMVSVSVNPLENNELALAKKQGYLAEYSRAGADKGLHFLTAVKSPAGAEVPAKIADSVGFQYRALPSGEYAHPAVFVMLAPDGTIVRYLYGVKFEPESMRLAILEAGQGTIGTPWDRFVLWCHQYDPSSKGYVLFAFRLMQIGGGVTVIAIATGLIWMFVRSAKAARLMPHSA